MCERIVKVCNHCREECGSRVSYCEVGKKGYVHVRSEVNTSSPLLRVVKNDITKSNELDMNSLIPEKIIPTVCRSCRESS